MANRNLIDKANTYYHVYNRGVNKQTIFNDNEDRYFFIHLCKKSITKYEVSFAAFCLMGNHYHLVIHTKKANLSLVMKYIGEKYSKYFLSKYKMNKKVGHTFQGPYGRKIISNEQYFQYLLSYIHLNPVKDGFVAHPCQYFWSSYKQYETGSEVFDFLNIDEHITRFQKFSLNNQNQIDENLLKWEPRLHSYFAKEHEDLSRISMEYVDELIDFIEKYRVTTEIKRKVVVYSLLKWSNMNSSDLAEVFKMAPSSIRKIKSSVGVEVDLGDNVVSSLIEDVKGRFRLC